MFASLSLGLGMTASSAAAEPFDPASLSPQAWYDISDLTTLFQDSAGTIPAVVDGPVGRVGDKSGNGIHMLQATSDTRRPLLRQSGALYYLEFDGTDDRFVAASVTSASAAGYWCTVAGVSFDDTVGAEHILTSGGAAPGRADCSKNGAAPRALAYNSASTLFLDSAGTFTAGEAMVVTCMLGAGGLTARKNGVSNGSTAVTGTLNAGVSQNLSLGSLNNTSEFLNGNFYGAIRLIRDPSASELAGMEEWAASKAGVSL